MFLLYIFRFFFFNCLAAHPDLHSFPTRRSSDLGRLVHARKEDALHAARHQRDGGALLAPGRNALGKLREQMVRRRSEEHTSELQSLRHLVCRLLLEKKKKKEKNKCITRRGKIKR